MVNLHFENLSIEYCNQVFDIEKKSIGEPWSLKQIQSLAVDKKAVARVGIFDGELVCYYSFYDICNEGNINNLAVKENYRGKGIGKFLLEDMINLAKERRISALTLEVNENNTVAIQLYRKFGFAVEGKRSKFYNGTEDALIMWKREL
ncbi:MAG: ribosomal protein S18-alanine N-acetyltransferase [Clostridia bacterium]|nr:ribosomal protein S18-alanine N-acetyltransferase [Clostridia bacterium]